MIQGAEQTPASKEAIVGSGGEFREQIDVVMFEPVQMAPVDLPPSAPAAFQPQASVVDSPAASAPVEE